MLIVEFDECGTVVQRIIRLCDCERGDTIYNVVQKYAFKLTFTTINTFTNDSDKENSEKYKLKDVTRKYNVTAALPNT